MPKIAVDKIIVGDRARVEMGDDYEQLRDSIANRGMINSICVHKDNLELVAGFRRLSCHRDLGLKNIEVKYYESLSPLEQKLLELEENIHKELTWDEQAKLRTQIHELNQEIHGKAVKGHDSSGYGLEDTAKELNISTATLSQDIKLSEAVTTLPVLKKIASRRQALKALEGAEEAALLTELARREAEAAPENKRYHLHLGNSINYLKESVEDETIDLVIFDPPWGVDIDRIASSRGPKGEKTSYADDSEDTAVDTISKLLPEIHRVMKPDAHMFMFIGIQAKDFYLDILTNYSNLQRQIERWRTLFPEAAESLSMFEETIEFHQKTREWQFHVEEVPLIWVKEGGGYTDFEHKFMPRYEAILFCSKGVKKKLNEATSNVFEVKRPLTTERIHTQEKPIDLIQRFIKISTQPNEIVLDPCAGSFVSVVAATLLGRRSIGIDNDELCYAKGVSRLAGLMEGEEDEHTD